MAMNFYAKASSCPVNAPNIMGGYEHFFIRTASPFVLSQFNSASGRPKIDSKPTSI